MHIVRRTPYFGHRAISSHPALTPKLSLSLNSRNAPQLKVSRSYSEMLETYAASQKTKKDKEAIMGSIKDFLGKGR